MQHEHAPSGAMTSRNLFSPQPNALRPLPGLTIIEHRCSRTDTRPLARGCEASPAHTRVNPAEHAVIMEAGKDWKRGIFHRAAFYPRGFAGGGE